MKRMILTIGLCSAIFSCFSQELSLRECIDMGIERNLSLHRSNISVDIANNRLSENRSRLLPVLEANIQLTDFLIPPTNVTTGALLEGNIPNNPTWQQIRSMQYGVNAGIQLSMPIYNKAIFNGIDVAKTLVNISRLSTEQAKEELTAAIANVYYLAQASHEQASLLQDNIKRMPGGVHGQMFVYFADVGNFFQVAIHYLIAWYREKYAFFGCLFITTVLFDNLHRNIKQGDITHLLCFLARLAYPLIPGIVGDYVVFCELGDICEGKSCEC